MIKGSCWIHGLVKDLIKVPQIVYFVFINLHRIIIDEICPNVLLKSEGNVLIDLCYELIDLGWLVGQANFGASSPLIEVDFSDVD